MKYLKLLSFLLIVISLLFASCDRFKKIEVNEIPFKTIKNLSVCGDSCYLKNTKNKDTTIVINNQSEYESLFECNYDYELPVIDFSIYTLLVGSKPVNNICPTILSQHVFKYPIKNKIVYDVQIQPGRLTALGTAYYHALVSKIDQQYDVEFVVTVIDSN